MITKGTRWRLYEARRDVREPRRPFRQGAREQAARGRQGSRRRGYTGTPSIYPPLQRPRPETSTR